MKTLQEIYQNYSGQGGEGDKGTAHSYIDYYAKWFDAVRLNNLNVLEIGVAQGKSVKMWKEYFSNSHIYGVDIEDKTCYSEPNLTIFHADATGEQFAELVKDLSFDIIIDDGAHYLEQQVKSCKILLPRLNSGGIYVIEDIIGFPEQATSINEEFNNIFEINDLRHERPGFKDNVLLVYRKP